MGSNVTPQYMRGFLVPLDVGTNNVWDAQSTFSTAQERAGDPVSLQNTPMQLIAKGQQESPSDLTIETKKAGFAGYGAGFVFTDNQTSTTYGRDPQNTMSRYQNIKFSITSSNQYRHVTGLDMQDGSLVVSFYHLQTVLRSVKVGVLLQDDTYTETTVYTEEPSITAYDLHSATCRLPDGNILLVHIAGDNDSVNLKSYVSEDGSSWNLRSAQAFDEQIDIGTATGSGAAFENHNIQRLRMAQAGGTILLMIETIYNDTSATKRNRLLQYASTDLGATFKLITTQTEIELHSFHSIALYADKGLFRFGFYADKVPAYMTMPSAFTSAHTLRSAGAYVPVTIATTSGTNDYMTDGDLCIWTDEGASHIMVAKTSLFAEYRISYSVDGLTWSSMGQDINGAGRVLRTGDANSLIERSFGLSWIGKSIILTEPKSTSTNHSIAMLSLGGYSTVTLPPAYYANKGDLEWNRTSFSYSYPAVDRFSNFTGVTKTAIAGGENLNIGGVYIQNLEYFTTDPTTTGMLAADICGKGLLVHARIYSMAGGNNTNSYRGIYLKIDDTTQDYVIELRVTQTQIVVRDINASSNVITVSSLSLDTVEFIIALSTSTVSAYYRDASPESNRKNWIFLGRVATLSNGGGGASNLHRVRWGNLAYASATLTTVWTSISFAQGFQMSQNIHDFVNPDDLMYRAYPTIDRFAYVADNVLISTGDGQTFAGDQYNITPDSDYSINNIFYANSPSPRIQWRSEAVISGTVPEEFIAIKLDPDTTVHEDESLPNDIIGLHLSNYNFRTARLEYYSSGSWTVLDVFDSSINSTAIVSGRTLKGATGASNRPYLKYNECAGWRIRVQDTPTTYVWRTIVSNSEGSFGGSSTNKKAVLMLDESVSVSGISNSNVMMIPSNMTLLVDLETIKAEAFGLRITTQDTLEDDFRIGILHLGSVLIPGKQYQRGRTISIESGTELSETQSGIVYARNYRPSRRTFRLAWTEGIDITDLQGDNPDPDYWIADAVSGDPIATANDVPDLLQGLLKYLQGAKTPIVYLPLITTTAVRELHRDAEQALVMLTGEVQVENILGDELVNESGELVRIATITLQEVI